MTNNEIIKCLDKRQLSVCDNLPSEHWLSNKNNLLKFYEWNTFFRENLDMYAEIYFGFALYPYQHLELYELNKNTLIDITGSRATAKTYIIAIFAVCKASLYPNSKIVICSATKGQSKLVVSEKIKNELMSQSPMLCREIKSIKDNQNDVIVYFRNGSTIKVLPSSENARGNRSTVTIYEENRMIDKFIIDSVISPFAIIRPVPYLKYEEYADLVEEPTEVYISSAWYASHWMNTLIQDTYKAMLKGEKQCVIGLDYSVSLKHKIKTKNQILKDKRKFDPITFRIEYNNEMIKENTSAFFTYKMFTDNQRNKKPLYPRFDVDVLSRRKNPYSVSKQQGEIRILSCDMAFAEGKHNDNSIFTCMRLIPESTTYTVQSEGGTSKEISQGYRKIVSYIESIQGGDITKQAIRIKQLYEDFYEYKKDKVKATTLRSYRRNILQLSEFYELKIKDIKIEHYIAWRKRVGNLDSADKTKNGYYKLLKTILNYGTKWHDFNFTSIYNRMEKFNNPNKPPKEMQFYTWEEFKQFISVIDDIKWKALFEVLFCLGRT